MSHEPRASEERGAIFFEPSFGLAERGIRLFDEAPEPPRVVALPQVHQFVDQDVLADLGRHEQQAEVQRDVPARRARSPARALVANRNARDDEAVPLGEREKLRRQFDRGPGAQLVVGVGRTAICA